MSDRTHELRAPETLSADGLLLADGTLWSHACTIGQYNKGEAFSLGTDAIANFVRVFRTGYPNKVPVDYEHASTSNDPEVRKLRAAGEVPKAGDVLALQAVFSVADFDQDPTLKAAAEKLCALTGRSLDDPRNLGLWMRWKPTAKALGKIKAGEFSELSITFDDDYPDKTTGKGQGPTILAVALTMMPFLDDMLPVAASRGRREGEEQHDPATGASGARTSEEHIMSTKMLAAMGPLTGKPVANEDEAVTELTALAKEVPTLRQLTTDVAKELGVESPDKILAGVRALSAKVAESERKEREAQERAIATTVDATMKTHEAKLTPLSREIFADRLKGELAKGVKLEETTTVKALSAMPDLGITSRSSTADIEDPAKANDPDAQLDRVAKGLMESDAEIKALAATDRSAAYDRAVDKAAAQIGYKSQQLARVRGELTVV